MKTIRYIFGLLVAGALGYFLYNNIPREEYVRWMNRFNYLQYLAYPLIIIFYLIIVEIIIAKILGFIDWILTWIIAFYYGLTGKSDKESRKSAKKAFYNLLILKPERAASCFSNAGLPMNAASNYEKAGDYASAAESYSIGGAFEKAAEMYEKEKKYVSAAENYKKSGNVKKARNCFNQAAENFLSSGKTILAAEAFLKAGEHNRSAGLYEQTGHFRQAAEIYQKTNNDLKSADMYLAAAQQKKSRMIKRALDKHSSVSDPELISSASRAGEIYIRQGQIEKALEAFTLIGEQKKAAEICVDAGRFDKAAEILEQAGMWSHAKACYERLGKTADTQRMEAREAVENGNPAKAAEIYEQVGEIEKALEFYRNAHHHGGQARCLEKLGRPLAAAGYYAMTDQLGKAAELYEKAGDMTEAAKIYRKMGMLDSASQCLSDSHNPYYKALLEREKGDIEKAVSQLRNLPQTDPDYKRAMLLLGQCYLDQEKPSLALDTFQRVTRSLFPNKSNIEGFYSYALALEETGNFQHALEVYEEIEKVEDHFRDVKQRIESMKSKAKTGNKTTLEELAKVRKKDKKRGPIPVPEQFFDKSYSSVTSESSEFDSVDEIPDSARTIMDESQAGDNHTPAPERFQLMDPLGKERAEGGVSVFKARDRDQDCIVALKLFIDPMWNTPKARAGFRKSMEKVMSTEHENILPLFDYGVFREARFITMKFCEGGDLLSRARTEEGLTPEECLSIMGKITGALQKAHKNDLIHGDIKPSNILFSKKGTPFVSDFALSTIVADTTRMMEAADDLASGSILFMAPEIIQGDPFSRAGDVYSLGMTFFFMLMGQTPFDIMGIKGSDAVIDLHLKGEWPRPSEVRKEIPEKMDEIFLKCVDLDPDKRAHGTTTVFELIDSAKE